MSNDHAFRVHLGFNIMSNDALGPWLSHFIWHEEIIGSDSLKLIFHLICSFFGVYMPTVQLKLRLGC